MQWRLALAAAALTFAVAAPQPANPATGSPDQALESIALSFYQGEWAFSPDGATSTGIHDFDSKIQQVTPAAIGAEIARLHRALAAVDAIPASSLTLDGQADQWLLASDIKRSLFSLETRPDWRISPDYYVGIGSNSVFSVMERAYAPAATRLSFIIDRERAIPAMLATAEHNIEPDAVPAEYAQVGVADAKGAADFLRHDVPEAFADVHDAALQSSFARANAAAAAAFDRYASFVSTSVVPRAHAPFAIGAKAYSYLEELQNVQDLPLSTLLAVGEANLAKDRAAFIATARTINPNETPEQVAAGLAADHPPADQLIPSAQADLATLIAFIKAKGIIDLPEAPVVKAVPTPAFERQFTFASMDSPGPLETKATEAYYNVTPADPSWTAAQTEQHLGFFNRYNILVVSSHETYPGHYVNYLYNKREDLSLIRKLEWNVAFGEGWAHYDEQMMIDEGLGGGDPRYRLAQLSGALQRDGRYIIGIEEHTQGMSVAQATRFLTANAFMGEEPAYREALRGTSDPLFGYYTLGKLMILKLRADYQAKMGSSYSLRGFHDALLSHGDPPIYFVRKMLLGAGDQGALLAK
jgi:uncharacterized protein (DUF885 family)